MGEFITICLSPCSVKNLYLWKRNTMFYHQRVWHEHSACSPCRSPRQKQPRTRQSLKWVQNQGTQRCCTRHCWWHPVPCVLMTQTLPHWGLATLWLDQCYYSHQGFSSPEVFNYETNFYPVFVGESKYSEFISPFNGNILKRNSKRLSILLSRTNRCVRKAIILLTVLDHLYIPNYYRHHPLCSYHFLS